MCRKDKKIPALSEFDMAARNRQLLATSFTIQTFPPTDGGTPFTQLVLGYDDGPNKCEQIFPEEKEKPAAFGERVTAKISETYELFRARLDSKNIPLLHFADDGTRHGGVTHTAYFTPDHLQLIAQGTSGVTTVYTKNFSKGLTSHDPKAAEQLIRTLHALTNPEDWIEFRIKDGITIRALKNTIADALAVDDQTLQLTLAGITPDKDRHYQFQSPSSRETALSINIACGLRQSGVAAPCDRKPVMY